MKTLRDCWHIVYVENVEIVRWQPKIMEWRALKSRFCCNVVYFDSYKITQFTLFSVRYRLPVVYLTKHQGDYVLINQNNDTQMTVDLNNFIYWPK